MVQLTVQNCTLNTLTQLLLFFLNNKTEILNIGSYDGTGKMGIILASKTQVSVAHNLQFRNTRLQKKQPEIFRRIFSILS